MTLASWRLFTVVLAWCVVCPVSLTTWRLFTGVHAWCVVCAYAWLFALIHQFGHLVCSVCSILGYLALLCAQLVCGAAAFCAFVYWLWFPCAPVVLGAPYAFFLWCLLLGVVVVPWHLVLCRDCGPSGLPTTHHACTPPTMPEGPGDAANAKHWAGTHWCTSAKWPRTPHTEHTRRAHR